MDVVEANRLMECFKPVMIYRKKPRGVDGSQHLLEREHKFKFFKCDRPRPECKGANGCTFDEKTDGSDVNKLEVIATKFQELKEEIRRQKSVGGASYVIQGEVVPSWDDLIFGIRFA